MIWHIRSNNFLVLLIRILALYSVWGICRIVFTVYNAGLLGSDPVWDNIPPLINGGFVFDTVSILYLNIPFILLSLLPFGFVGRKGYQLMLSGLYVTVNMIGLIPNIADIFYFRFKQGRIAFDDWHFASEGGLGNILLVAIKTYWPGVLLWLLLSAALIYTARVFYHKPQGNHILNPVLRYGTKWVLWFGAVFFIVTGIRGFKPLAGTFPIRMNDALIYVRPELSAAALSNPFCFIRTIGDQYTPPQFFDTERLDSLAAARRHPAAQPRIKLEGKPNVVFIILESIGSPFIGELNPNLAPSLTPNLDSIFRDSYLFTNAYHNGYRSIDALPSIWASIPSLRKHFLSMPQSAASYHPITAALRDRGYTTQFYCGALRNSMSFESFGAAAGIEQFFSREDYEGQRGEGDFDGSWGIFDHKFLSYVNEQLGRTPQPFCSTVFTMSSHMPYTVPDDVAGMFPGPASFERSVQYADYALGEFFREARRSQWFANTLFVITADHHYHSTKNDEDENHFALPGKFAVPIAFYFPGEAGVEGLAGPGESSGSGAEISAQKGTADLEDSVYGAGAKLKGRDSTIMQHINIAPTLQSLLGIDEPLFGLGRDQFNDTLPPFAIFFNNGMFNYLTDNLIYQLDEDGAVHTLDYKKSSAGTDPLEIERMKTFVQQYYRHIADRDFR